VTNWQANIL